MRGAAGRRLHRRHLRPVASPASASPPTGTATSSFTPTATSSPTSRSPFPTTRSAALRSESWSTRWATPTPPPATAPTAWWPTLAVEDLARSRAEEVRRTVPARSAPASTSSAVSEGGLVATLAAERTRDRYRRRPRRVRTDRRLRQADRLLQRRPRGLRLLLPRRDPGQRRSTSPAEVQAGWMATYAPAVVAALAGGRPGRGAARAGRRHRWTRATSPEPPRPPCGGRSGTMSSASRTRRAPRRAALRQLGRVYHGLARRRRAERGRGAVHRRRRRPRGPRPVRDHGARHDSIPCCTRRATRSSRSSSPPVYAAKVAGGRGCRAGSRPHVDRFGHCAFEAAELLDRFRTRRARDGDRALD